MNNINEVINELTKAAQAYYQDETELMTDEEYDSKIEYLEDLVNQGELELTEELAELLHKVAAGSIPEGNTIEHNVPMLSLGKARSYEELERYHERLVKNGAIGFKLEVKLDGLALSSKYETEELSQLATRGDGVKGELLNYLINHEEVTIVGLPKSGKFEDELELRGELYMTDEQFEMASKARFEVTGEAFSNSRNAATGIVRRAERGMEYPAELTFSAYSAYLNEKQIPIDEIEGVENISTAAQVTENEIKRLSTEEFGLKSAEIKSIEFEDLKNAVEIFGKLREQFKIPTDGVVIKPINEIEMLDKLGFTSRHPVANIAFKYPGQKALTVVEDIIVSVGKTGRLTPQAIVTPVEVDGVIINNITCHNFSWLNTMGIRVGSKVLVHRANDVIPAIHTVVDKGPNSAVAVPTHCPECDELLLGDGTSLPKTLICENETCPSRLLYYMKSIVGRNFLYIDGLGDVALEALVDQDIITGIVDLFNLDEDVLATVPTGVTSTGNVRMLGAGNAKNIMKSIENAKINTDSNKLLAALNIKGVGPNTAKRLIAHFGGIKEVLTAEPIKLTQVNQVGESVVAAFIKQGQVALKELDELIELGVIINDPIVSEEIQEIKGSFSVSGSIEGFDSQSDLVRYMEGLGWEYHKSPKKSTNVLFADPEGTSNKIKKAKKDGVRIIDNIKDL